MIEYNSILHTYTASYPWICWWTPRMVHSLGTVSSEAITTNVQVLRRHVILKPVGYIPRCGMTMPYASSNLSCCFVAAFWFWGPSIQIYTEARSVYSSLNRMERFLLPTPSPAFVAVSFLKDTLSSGGTLTVTVIHISLKLRMIDSFSYTYWFCVPGVGECSAVFLSVG